MKNFLAQFLGSFAAIMIMVASIDVWHLHTNKLQEKDIRRALAVGQAVGVAGGMFARQVDAKGQGRPTYVPDDTDMSWQCYTNRTDPAMVFMYACAALKAEVEKAEKAAPLAKEKTKAASGHPDEQKL